MSLLYPEGDTDRPTPITAPKSQRSTAAQQLRPGERLGETEMGTLVEQNKNKCFSNMSGNKKNVYII